VIGGSVFAPQVSRGYVLPCKSAVLNAASKGIIVKRQSPESLYNM